MFQKIKFISKNSTKLLVLFLFLPIKAWAIEVVQAFPFLEFEKPLYLVAPPDSTNRLFVVEQEGQIFWFRNDPDIKKKNLALDLTQKVRSQGSEEGLLGFAFDPQFATNRKVYLCYSASRPRRNVISRFLMDSKAQRIIPSSEKKILEVNQPYSNHNGGMMAFGPDGYLYISLGDGGSAGDPEGHGQNKRTLLGAILRLDVNVDGPGYQVPKNNPFIGESGSRPEIWAYGLRNVWRFSFDRETGTLWAGDVGQNAREEINIIKKGLNYGWNYREGKIPYRKAPSLVVGLDFEDPIIDLPRNESRSVTGGYVYRGKKLPALKGKYIFGDFVTGNIWALSRKGRSAQYTKIGKGFLISSFGEDQEGEIYFTSFRGKVYTLIHSKQKR